MVAMAFECGSLGGEASDILPLLHELKTAVT
jgi:hypothetical protein